LLPSVTAIEKGVVSSGQPPTRVYFQRQTENQDLFQNGSACNKTTVFDVEVAALNDDATTQSMADTLKNALNGFQGAFGSANNSWALGMFVSDHTDEYEPRLLDADEGYTIATFQVEVIT
jgi:hypothetical protein